MFINILCEWFCKMVVWSHQKEEIKVPAGWINEPISGSIPQIKPYQINSCKKKQQQLNYQLFPLWYPSLLVCVIIIGSFNVIVQQKKSMTVYIRNLHEQQNQTTEYNIILS